MRGKFTFMFVGMLLCFSTLFAQRTITGKVTDVDGAPVINASVMVKGTNLGTTTNDNGNYSISVPSANSTLVFTSVGMLNEERVVGNQSVINVSLQSVSTELSEVVVQVPYGTVRKIAFTGSEATVNAASIQKQQVTSVTRAIEGLVPGIISTNGGGAPGSNASILVRGVGSVNASSAPLYVLNGVPYDGSISALNTDDIESVTVLKDASAAALYGSRAANGVIMITTKKGSKGRNTVTFNVRQGFMNRFIEEYDRVDARDYYELMWESIRNNQQYGSGLSAAVAGANASNMLTGNNALVYNAYNVPGNQLVDPVTGKLNPSAQLLWNDSWENVLYRTASRQNITMNVSGGGDNNDFMLSGGYLNEDGIVKFSGYKRYNARLNVNANPVKWFKTGLNVDGALNNRSDFLAEGSYTTNPFYYTRQMGPIYPVWQRDATGNFVIDEATGERALDWGKPAQMGTRPYGPNSNLLGSLRLDDRSSKFFNGNANTYMEILFLKDFSFKTTLGVNYYNSNGTTYQNSQFGDADNVKGRSTKSALRQTSLTMNEVLTWQRSFGIHNVRALVGHENYKWDQNYASATKTNFAFPGSSELDNASVNEGSSSYSNFHRIEGYFSNVNYDYEGKYLVSASYRRDGTSRFYVDNRWGDFYSLGLGWVISRENFMRAYDWLNHLKLRASYGEQGNESIGTYYAYQTLYSAGWNNAARPGYLASGLPNPELVWEGNKTFNVGMDFSLLNNKFQGTVEYFKRISDNMLFDVPLPTSTGNTSITQNIGTMYNAGVEFQLAYNVIRNSDFRWRIDLNLTHFKNKITKLPELQRENGIVSGTKKLMEGKGIYDFWLKEYAGVDASTGDALYYKDVMGADGKPSGERILTNKYSEASFYYVGGSALPNISGGITNTVSYKGFDLSVLFTFAQGGKFYDGNYQSLMHRGSFGTAWHTDILNRWQKPGDVTNVPRIQNAVADQEGTSSRYLFDGSYGNIKNITLSYELPGKWMDIIGISGLQIYGNVDNAYLFSSKQGMDAQRSFTGTSDWSYTPFRTYTIGLSVNL